MSEGPVVYAAEPLQVYLDDAASGKPAPGGFKDRMTSVSGMMVQAWGLIREEHPD